MAGIVEVRSSNEKLGFYILQGRTNFWARTFPVPERIRPFQNFPFKCLLVPHWDASTLPNPSILHKKIKREYFRDTSDWARLSQRSWRLLHSKLALRWNHDCCKFPLGRTQRNSWTCFIRQFSPLSVDYQFVISSADSQFLILVYVSFPLVTSATFIDKLAKRLWKSVCA